jgi:tetratricopeptide (TPR) repeat protein
VTDAALERRDAMAAALSHNLGKHLQQAGDYRGALLYEKRALELREALFAEDSVERAALSLLAALFAAAEMRTEARAFYERALEIREKALGPEHPDLAGTLNDLAFLEEKEGDLTAALGSVSRAYLIREKALGEQHPETALCVHNLGYFLFMGGPARRGPPLLRAGPGDLGGVPPSGSSLDRHGTPEPRSAGTSEPGNEGKIYARRYAPGGTPTQRLNALLNAASAS